MIIDKTTIYIVNDYSFTNFISLDEEVLKQIWQWRNDSKIRKYMYNKEIIPYENHINFVHSLKHSNNIFYWLVKKREEPIGVTNLTDVNFENSSAELGYYIIPPKLDSGLGLEFAYNNLRFVFATQIQCNYLHGGIHRNNINALVLDSYLGCDIQMKDLKDPNKEFISFTAKRDKFLSEAEGKNDMHSFISYVRKHRKDFKL